MADKLKSGIVALPDFSDGTQPTAKMLNSLGDQVENGLQEVEKAIGDIHSESYPYSGSTGTHLTQVWGKNPASGNDLSNAIERRLDIVNLARLIGPAANLNPTTLDIVGSITNEVVPVNCHEYQLRYLPSNTPTFSDAAVFANPVADPTDISAAGDYAVDGRSVHAGSLIVLGTTISYETTPTQWGQGSSYSHGRFNVIPDPNQIEAGSSEVLGIVGPDANSRYTLSLPAVRVQQTNYDGDSTALLAAEDSSYDVQLQLPYVLTENLSSGDVIPEGFLYLRNHTSGELYTEATYYYNSETSVQIGGVDLSGAAAYDYYLITVGSDITTAIDDLRQKQFKHSHDGTFGEAPISIFSVTGFTQYAGFSGAFCSSNMPSNFAPQYLHRDGISALDSNLNDRNGMRGWLGFIFQGQGAGEGFGPAAPGLTATYGLSFGDPTDTDFRGRIYKNTANEMQYEAPVSNLPTLGVNHRFSDGPVLTEEGVVATELTGQTAWKIWTGEVEFISVSTAVVRTQSIAELYGKEIYEISVIVDIDPAVGAAGTPVWLSQGSGSAIGLDFAFSVYGYDQSIGTTWDLEVEFDGAAWNGSTHDVRYVIRYKD